MKTSTRNPKNDLRLRTRWGHRLKVLSLLPLATLMMMAPGAQAAKPGGVTVLLPPFSPVPAPQKFLQPVSPFEAIGFIQTATVDNPTDPLSGGTMEINGLKIVVPRNTIFQLPATNMSWSDLFANAPANYKALNQTGMALNDTPKPFTTYEVSVVGNRVISGTSDQYIAGLIVMSQHALNAAQGYINCIDYVKHEIWVGQTLQGTTPCTGARLRINTPSERYGKQDPLADPRFTSDEDNPTIRSEIGYPMCLPRVDPAVGVDSLCPVWNRPKDPFTGAFAPIFTMGAATAGPVGADGITHQIGYPNPPVKPDPFEQAPFEVGDSVTYAGTLMNDAPCVAGQPISSCQYISAHTIIASVAIFTAPGSKPVYVGIEDQLLGVGGTPNPMFPQEAVEKLVMVSFSTDPTQLVDFYAVDKDSCTGVETHRFYGTADPFGPPIGGVKGRARIRSFIGNYLPPTRDMAAASRTLTGGAPMDSVNIPLVANGISAGQYQAPTFEYIFPENFLVGSPQVPLLFQEFPFLLNGSGPYVPFASTTGAAVGTIGQLSPWPGSTAPPASCGISAPLISAPIANAGAPQSVPSGALVTLNASASSDTNTPPLALNYTWVQTAGPAVALSGAAVPNPTFTAPTLASGAIPVTLTFGVSVCNGFSCSAGAFVNVTVSAASAGPSVTFSAAPAQNVLTGTAVTLTATGTGTGLTYTFAQTAGPVQTRTTTGNVTKFTATLPAGTPLPSTLTFTVTVKDSSARTATATISVFVGADTITVGTATYKLRKSQLSVTASTNVPAGKATLTMTPLDGNGVAIGSAVVMIYDPTLNSYTTLQDIFNPLPAAVRIVSSYGGSIISPLTTIR